MPPPERSLILMLPKVEIRRKHGLRTATFYTLRDKYGGMKVSVARRLRQIED
jgi:putative transposase